MNEIKLGVIMSASGEIDRIRLKELIYEYNFRVGIPISQSCDYFQTIYTSAGKGPEYNRYNGYKFEEIDALNWLIQTGGKISIVLQTRDTKDIKDPKNQITEMVNGEWNILEAFCSVVKKIDDYHITNKIIMPYFYIGSPEENVLVEYYNDYLGIISIYEQIIENMKKDYKKYIEKVKGVYFGSESIRNVHLGNLKVYLGRNKSIIWFPYAITKNNFDDVIQHSEKTVKDVKSDDLIITDNSLLNERIFSKVIIQPSNFYRKEFAYVNDHEKPISNGLLKKWKEIFEYINEKPEIYGVELEFDMGLYTGRANKGPKMFPLEKRKEYARYITYIFLSKSLAKSKKIIGIYSGGPNEQGYNAIDLNTNSHGNENHIPYYPTVAGFTHGSYYNELVDSMNLIYTINSILYGKYSFQIKYDKLISLFPINDNYGYEFLTQLKTEMNW